MILDVRCEMTARLHAPWRERPTVKDYSILDGAQLPNMHTCLWYAKKNHVVCIDNLSEMLDWNPRSIQWK